MRYTVALDVSEKPGWAIFHDLTLHSSGTLWQEHKKADLGPYPYNYIQLAVEVSARIFDDVLFPVIKLMGPTDSIDIVIEETTASSQNYSQKILEFIHAETLNLIRTAIIDSQKVITRVSYIRDGVWKRICGATQSKVERNWNARVSRNKKKRGKTIAMLVTEKGGKAHRVRKLNAKDYAIRALKEIHGLEFAREREDECDAILLGTAFLWGAPVCDGTDEGGVLTDPMKNEILKIHAPHRVNEEITEMLSENPSSEEADEPAP